MSSQVAARARERISLPTSAESSALLILRSFRSCLRFRPKAFLKLVVRKMEVNSSFNFVSSCGNWSSAWPWQATHKLKGRLWHLSRFTLSQVMFLSGRWDSPEGEGERPCRAVRADTGERRFYGQLQFGCDGQLNLARFQTLRESNACQKSSQGRGARHAGGHQI